MTVLSIGSDRALFEEGSAVLARAKKYATCLGDLHIIAFSHQRHQLKEVDIEDNVHLYPTNSWIRLFYIADAFLIGRRLARIDVVTTQDPFESGLAGVLLSRALGVPLHVQVHTDLYSPYFKKGLLNRVRLVLARYVLKNASRIKVVSSRIKNDIEKRIHTHAPITVLPIFVDTGRFREASIPDSISFRFSRFKNRFLVVSRLEKEKDVMRALEAFSHIEKESCLIILGVGSEKRRLQVKANELGVSERVFFEGVKDPAPYYKQATLVLYPSRYDGYGMVIIEALAAGTPVLSTDVGVAREGGAIITGHDFTKALLEWVENGPREGVLTDYPYKNEEEYVRAYCEDVRTTSNVHI